MKISQVVKELSFQAVDDRLNELHALTGLNSSHCASSPIVWRSSLSLNMVVIQWQVKVINYRLLEGISQTFNEELFLPFCKLYNK